MRACSKKTVKPFWVCSSACFPGSALTSLLLLFQSAFPNSGLHFGAVLHSLTNHHWKSLAYYLGNCLFYHQVTAQSFLNGFILTETFAMEMWPLPALTKWLCQHEGFCLQHKNKTWINISRRLRGERKNGSYSKHLPSGHPTTMRGCVRAVIAISATCISNVIALMFVSPSGVWSRLCIFFRHKLHSFVLPNRASSERWMLLPLQLHARMFTLLFVRFY